MRVCTELQTWPLRNCQSGERPLRGGRARLMRSSWALTRLVRAAAARVLFFQRTAGRASFDSPPWRHSSGSAGSSASAVAMPATAIPLSITWRATALRAMPPVSISGMLALPTSSCAKLRK